MRKVSLIVLMMAVGLPQGKTAVRLGAQAGAAQGITGTGILLIESPFFLLPDPNRTPLATLAGGTAVKVLGKEGDWYKVVHHDSFLGDRTGYLQAANVRIEAAASPPAGNRAAPGRATPQANAPRPRSPATTSRKPSSWSDRGYLWVNATYQATSNGFTAATTFTQNVEAATLNTTYSRARPPVLDVGGTARVWRNLALGAAVTWLSHAQDGTLSASIPHPFLFNTPRTVTGAVADIPRQELALHLNASWVIPAGRKAQIAIFGGPSYFQVKQGLVTDVSSSSVYPYDTATFVGATTVQSSKSQLGFNGGLDVIARVSKHVGVGAIVRYSRASLEFPAAPDQTVTVRAGGLQVGGGVRFAF